MPKMTRRRAVLAGRALAAPLLAHPGRAQAGSELPGDAAGLEKQ